MRALYHLLTAIVTKVGFKGVGKALENDTDSFFFVFDFLDRDRDDLFRKYVSQLDRLGLFAVIADHLILWLCG